MSIAASTTYIGKIPSDIPFLADRPDHWTSPAPGIDDAAPIVGIETASDTSSSDIPENQPINSAFDGRGIPRPPIEIHRGNQELIKAEENMDECHKASSSRLVDA